MKEKERYITQRKTAEKNKNMILISLLLHPKTFTELKNEIGLSPTGLSKIIHRLLEAGLIQNVIYSKAYELTKKGTKIVKAIPIIQSSIDQIMDNEHSYRNKIGEYSLGYKGISYDILREGKIRFGLFDLFNKSVEEKLDDVNELIGKIPDIVNDKSELKGKMVLAFTIDFDDMKAQFLNRHNKTWTMYGINWTNEEKWLKLFKNSDTQ